MLKAAASWEFFFCLFTKTRLLARPAGPAAQQRAAVACPYVSSQARGWLALHLMDM